MSKHIDRQIAKGAQLDIQIKSLQSELEEIKAELKEALAGQYETFLADERWTVTVKPYRQLDKVLAEKRFGDDAKELVVTPAAVKRAVETKYAGKPTMVEKKLNELYRESPALTFGVRG